MKTETIIIPSMHGPWYKPTILVKITYQDGSIYKFCGLTIVK